MPIWEFAGKCDPSLYFQRETIRDKIITKLLFGIVYGSNVPTLEDNVFHYVGETKVRHETRTYQHAYIDKNSAVYQHSHEQNFTVDLSNFTSLAKEYPIWINRRICEALFVKDHNPFLNRQKESHKLERFAYIQIYVS